jgi:hypothetical protein
MQKGCMSGKCLRIAGWEKIFGGGGIKHQGQAASIFLGVAAMKAKDLVLRPNRTKEAIN